MGITKTDFMRGMQCPKMLWLDAHKSKEKIIPPETQLKLDQGNAFGDAAMGMFGPFEEMTVYKPGTTIPNKTAMLEKTKEHLANGTEVICEAAFSYYNNYCAVDILRKTESGYDFYEVKNAPEVKEQFVKDAGFQLYILTKCGLKIGHVYIVYHGPDENDPFVPEEITDRARNYTTWVNENIWSLNKLKKQSTEVMVTMGEQCSTPYECWYCDYCKRLNETPPLFEALQVE